MATLVLAAVSDTWPIGTTVGIWPANTIPPGSSTAILRHKDSEVTRRTYVHAIHSVEQHARLGDLLEKMSSGMARTDGDTAAQPPVAKAADVAYLSEIRETA
jgi:hypothetical protein